MSICPRTVLVRRRPPPAPAAPAPAAEVASRAAGRRPRRPPPARTSRATRPPAAPPTATPAPPRRTPAPPPGRPPTRGRAPAAAPPRPGATAGWSNGCACRPAGCVTRGSIRSPPSRMARISAGAASHRARPGDSCRKMPPRCAGTAASARSATGAARSSSWLRRISTAASTACRDAGRTAAASASARLIVGQRPIGDHHPVAARPGRGIARVQLDRLAQGRAGARAVAQAAQAHGRLQLAQGLQRGRPGDLEQRLGHPIEQQHVELHRRRQRLDDGPGQLARHRRALGSHAARSIQQQRQTPGGRRLGGARRRRRPAQLHHHRPLAVGRGTGRRDGANAGGPRREAVARGPSCSATSHGATVGTCARRLARVAPRQRPRDAAHRQRAQRRLPAPVATWTDTSAGAGAGSRLPGMRSTSAACRRPPGTAAAPRSGSAGTSRPRRRPAPARWPPPAGGSRRPRRSAPWPGATARVFSAGP